MITDKGGGIPFIYEQAQGMEDTLQCHTACTKYAAFCNMHQNEMVCAMNQRCKVIQNTQKIHCYAACFKDTLLSKMQCYEKCKVAMLCSM